MTLSLPRVSVRACTPDDVDLLERVIPSPGLSRFHESRFADHRAGACTYLIAWMGARPVGHLVLKWYGADEARVRALLPEVPEINALGVSPPERRGQGVGTLLIRDAERRASERGYARIGLAVAIDNLRAERLYRRLGYADWGHGTVDGSWRYLSDSGDEVVVTETTNYLVKELPPNPWEPIAS